MALVHLVLLITLPDLLTAEPLPMVSMSPNGREVVAYGCLEEIQSDAGDIWVLRDPELGIRLALVGFATSEAEPGDAVQVAGRYEGGQLVLGDGREAFGRLTEPHFIGSMPPSDWCN